MYRIDINYTYREPNKDQITRFKLIREKARELADLVHDSCPDSRERSLAFTNIEQAVMWSNAAIVRNE